ncbi:hypothetical protein Tco_0863125 [Tanacetum coccineum]
MTSSNSQMHNDIMAVGSKERPRMLASGSFSQWKSRFMRYVDTKLNRELLGKCIYEGPYKMTLVQLEDTPSDDENLRRPGEIVIETYTNTTQEKRKLIDAEAEAVHMILNEIVNDIYSTLDACLNAKEIWIAIEQLQQGESINKQDVKTKLFWVFVKEIRAERIAKNANPLALVAAIQQYPDDYYQAPQAPKPYKTHALSSRQTHQPYHMLPPGEKAKILSNHLHLYLKHSEWLHYTDDKPDEQELEAHYMYMAKIQEVLHVTDDNSGPTYDAEQLEKIDINVKPDSLDMSTNGHKADQNVEEPKDERVLLASLIANLKLDVDENKNIEKQLKKANTSLT